MKNIKIDKNIPMPDPTRRFHPHCVMSTLRFALINMKVGDSFMWPCNKTAWKAATQLGVMITTRRENDSYRIWLVSRNKHKPSY